jgi:hypothetical protein
LLQSQSKGVCRYAVKAVVCSRGNDACGVCCVAGLTFSYKHFLTSQSLVSELMLILLNAEAFQISGPGGIFLWKGKRFALILYLERRGKGKRKTLDWAG